VVPANRRLN